MNMMENLRFVKEEIEAIKYINNLKKSGEYEKQIEQDKQKALTSKMDVLRIKSVYNL